MCGRWRSPDRLRARSSTTPIRLPDHRRHGAQVRPERSSSPANAPEHRRGMGRLQLLDQPLGRYLPDGGRPGGGFRSRPTTAPGRWPGPVRGPTRRRQDLAPGHQRRRSPLPHPPEPVLGDPRGGPRRERQPRQHPPLAALAGRRLDSPNGGRVVFRSRFPGSELAQSTDFIIASENATFGQPEAMLGLAAGGGSPALLPRLLPRGKALQMLMTGDPITAQEAHRLGMVNELHPPGRAAGRGAADRREDREQLADGGAGRQAGRPARRGTADRAGDRDHDGHRIGGQPSIPTAFRASAPSSKAASRPSRIPTTEARYTCDSTDLQAARAPDFR